MSSPGRPLSPHLFIYRWPITMTLSILHRVTGVVLTVGLILYAAWLMAAAADAGPYLQLTGLLDSLLGRAVLVGFSAAFFFHLGNGIRHLFWDAGRGLEKSQANASAWFVVGWTIAATLLYWWLR